MIGHESRFELDADSQEGRAVRQAGRWRIWAVHGIYSVFIYGMLAEWLIPFWALLGSEGEKLLSLFFIFTGVLLAAGCAGLQASGILLLALGASGTVMYLLFAQEQGVLWFKEYGRTLSADAAVWLQTGHLTELSRETRMLLLLVGWFLLAAVVQQFVLSKRHVLLFWVITLLFLTLLEMLTMKEMYSGTVRVCLYALLLQLLINFTDPPSSKLKKFPGISSNDLKLSLVTGRKLGVCLLLGSCLVISCIGLSAGFNMTLPAAPLQRISWEDTVRKLEAWTETNLTDTRSTSSHMTGYSKDDSALGAPLEQHRSRFLTVISPEPTYLRGETLSYYDGRGWSRMENYSTPFKDRGESPVTYSQENEVRSTSMVQTITYERPQSGDIPLLGGGPIQRIQIKDGSRELTEHPGRILYNQASDSAFIRLDGQGEVIRSYQVEVGVPLSDPRLLEEHPKDPAEIRYTYLQLPSGLPSRVRELGARLIPDDSATRYEAVMAVKDYLQRTYPYTLNTKVPKQGHDFVDDFLFEQRTGYCDHFSTSMVVLLRTQGIPARWVKGFAPGEQDSSNPQKYHVRSSDAHSWVEVYFGEAGWFPFEPTPGFTAAGTKSASDDALAESEIDSWRKLSEVTGMGIKNMVSGILDGRSNSLAIPAAILLIIGAGIAGYYHPRIDASRFRGGAMPKQERGVFPGREVLLGSADRAWKSIYRKYGRKPAGITAREYAAKLKEIDKAAGELLQDFIEVWELLYYGGNSLDRRASLRFLDQCRRLRGKSGRRASDVS
ncbi:hypothetical protein DCC85_03455 [Paenibacillus sp. CAA11]|uniref:transglutaminase family protein n=1 Tax=Paenibacillus sp. CAA11 TaxID=1532905 RepID=UPI000D37BF20|nr:transglutaminase family protein [Paenibacillus sp. CAA11]AWB43371.1 hypothetical protein DCC85_03455 [Paenibacillus sp. CAA11]